MTILVDGIRSGMDVFKALALGANGGSSMRHFRKRHYGAGRGVAALVEKLGAELKDTMAMCGVPAWKSGLRTQLSVYCKSEILRSKGETEEFLFLMRKNFYYYI